MLPKAILFDLDDTLISAYNQPHRAWLTIAHEFSADVAPVSAGRGRGGDQPRGGHVLG